MTSYCAKPQAVTHGWIVIDADGAVVGRLASFVARRLRGKHRVEYTPHVDTGDHVIIVNAGKVHLTGNKRAGKEYYRHTGYPGGLRTRRAGEILDGRFPERVLQMAVRRMIPKESSLARHQLGKLHVYAGTEHPHQAQKPTLIDFAGMNGKNTRNKKT